MGAINSEHWAVLPKETDIIVVLDCLVYWVLALKDPLLNGKYFQGYSKAVNKELEFKNIIEALPKGVFHTLNCLLNILRPVCKMTSLCRGTTYL